MGEKIAVTDLYKIFGPHPDQAMVKVREGMGKDQLFRETGHTIGVYNANFTVEEGEIFVVMGLSGSGKSTLIRCLNRLFEPTAGRVVIDGEDITAMDLNQLREFRRNKQAMVFQRFALLPHRTVLENAAFGLEIQEKTKEERERRGLEALELVGLGEWGSRYPDQLSGGMQQRVGLARCLAVDPEILFMDEAFSALDPLIRREMQDELLALQEKVGKTIVFITHDLDEALKLGDRVAIMKDGVTVQIDTPENILTNPSDDYVAKFVEDVDLAKVLTAEGVMVDVKAVAYPKDGPRVVLRKMGEEGISGVFVVNRNRQLQGYVTADAAKKAAEKGEPDLTNVIEKDLTTVAPETTLNELFETAANATIPVAVVDEENHLKGVIVRGSLLAGLVKVKEAEGNER